MPPLKLWYNFYIKMLQVFQCRAHIYQGRISPGADETALCDSFVRLTIGAHSRQTKVVVGKIYVHLLINSF